MQRRALLLSEVKYGNTCSWQVPYIQTKHNAADLKSVIYFDFDVERIILKFADDYKFTILKDQEPEAYAQVFAWLKLRALPAARLPAKDKSTSKVSYDWSEYEDPRRAVHS